LTSGWRAVPEDNLVCGFTPSTLVECEIRARRECSCPGNRYSEVATDIVETKASMCVTYLYWYCLQL